MDKEKLMLLISTPDGFFKRYLQHLVGYTTQMEAYENTEDEHQSIFLRRRYSSFDSFRQVKNRRFKNN